MHAAIKALVAGALVVSFSGVLHADEPTAPKPADLAKTQAKMKLATGIITLGRADKDPLMLVVGARILRSMGTVGYGKRASDAYDVSAILKEAKALAGDKQYLLDEISAVPMERAAHKPLYCNWYENCNFDVTDPYKCEWVNVCD
jgi:hypothetical protein